MRTPVLLRAAIGILLTTVRIAAADPIRIDQSATTAGSSGVAIGGCCELAAQVFTAGVTADLVALSVDITARHVFPLRLAVTTVAGLPIVLPNPSEVLAEVFIAGGFSPLDNVINLPQPFRQVEGTQYAIVASYPTADTQPPEFTGVWRRTAADTYSGGQNFSRLTDGGWILQLGGDARFKTFVSEPVPEPATLILFGSGLGGAALIRRRRVKISTWWRS